MMGDPGASGPPIGVLRLGILLLVMAAGVVSCGGSDGEGLPDDALILVVSSDLSVGHERVLVSAIDRENRSLVTDRPVRLAFIAPDGTARAEVPASFEWAIPEVRGMWVARVAFDVPGNWTPAIRTPDDRLVRGVPFSVAPESLAVAVGDTAPASRSKTLAGGPIEAVTTDPDPDPRLYETTVAEAVRSGRPSVIVFATPAFCTSRTCGPVLDSAKALLDRYPDVNWIHVEVYDNLDAPTTEALIPTDPVLEWGLPSEPWVFVVDAAGIVADRFEGVVGRAELDEALARVTA